MKVKMTIVILVGLGFSTLSYSQFVEESKAAGIDHYCYDPNQLSAGTAFFDFNNDGFQDIVLTGTYNDSKIYENQGNGKFIDASERVGLLKAGNFRASAVITGDFDNNGFTDLFFSSFTESRNYLFWNQDGSSFVEGATQAGVGQSFYGTSCAVADYNLDGDLDLFVGNYTGQDYMYVNNGDMTFTLREDLFRTPSGVGSALSVAFSDIDADGDMDLLLGNEYERPPQLANRLYINNYPNDSFTEMSEAMNWDLKINTMGIAPGDYDEDGDLDYYVSDISDNYFFEKKSGLALEEKAYGLGIANDESTSWGSSFFDYDNDTYLDLFVANGNIGTSDSETDNDKLFKGTATKSFQDVAATQHIDSDFLGRGVSIGDYDNDGKLDVIVGVMWYESAVLKNTHTLLYRNDNKVNDNWIKINLQGKASNADGYGSRIEARIGNRTLIRELTGGGTYMSQNSKVIHFGLGAASEVDELTIKWPGNTFQDTFEDVKAGKTYTLVEGGDLYENEYHTVVLLNGESIFLQREERTINGIYHDTIAATSPETSKKIITTRLSFTGNAAEVGTDGNDEDNEEREGHSVARMWSEALLTSIRNDYARPTVHARNLFHTSIAMYDAFAVYDEEAEPYFLGNTIGEHQVAFDGIEKPQNRDSAQEEAISYACYRLLSHRFKHSPGSNRLLPLYRTLMQQLGYDVNNTSIDYKNGSPAALGNYLGEQLIAFGLQDGSNEANQYANISYEPKNEALVVNEPGNPTLTHPNNWQPLALDNFIDQSGNVIGADTPEFLSPEWGKVVPFALKQEQLTIKNRDGQEYWVYHDPKEPGKIKSDGTLGLNDPYKWNFSLVSIWSSHLDPSDKELIDISPAVFGNLDISDYPATFEEYQAFYDLIKGGDASKGHTINPITKQPYQPQIVAKGDYTRVLAEFWADGPDSETPPGHWFRILNYVSDHPLMEKKFNGKGEILSDLEWDVKSYLILAGALHDAAITAWGIKGYYDYTRPISAIRYMAEMGQSSNKELSNYHPEGIPLVPGYIEVVQNDDVLAGANNENAGKIKLYAWKGSHFIENPESDVAGVDWILAEDWVPYQRPSFVTPPFAGYISGHSTFSRAAAEVLTKLTGSNYFPGGLGTFNAEKNKFLVFEDGPSGDLTLQWATYQDASDQCSLSRIWGGIHPPIDDIPGRLIGEEIGENTFEKVQSIFYTDEDGDGLYSYEDCNDKDALINKCPVENDEINYKLFPVPVEDIMTLNINYNGVLTLYTYNIFGAKIYSKEIVVQNRISEISMENLTTGAYILVFTDRNGKKIISKKIIKL